MWFGTQGGSFRVPIGHGAFLRVGALGRSGAYGQRDGDEPELARKASHGVLGVTVPKTDTGG
jgi:hypothetical protein